MIKICAGMILAIVYMAVCGSPTTRNPMGQPKDRVAQVQWTYGGTISATGDGWIEIKAGWTALARQPREGAFGEPDTTKAKRISTVGTIAGGDPKGVARGSTYLVKDLVVGDLVKIDTGIDAAGTEEWTTRILVRRRPGGKVPPLEGPDSVNPWHEFMQAEQDWEEKGIPIPAEYLTDGRTNSTNPPYPPVAPLPREGKARPPIN